MTNVAHVSVGYRSEKQVANSVTFFVNRKFVTSLPMYASAPLVLIKISVLRYSNPIAFAYNIIIVNTTFRHM